MLHVAWLGDSQVMLVRRGQAVELMKPHKPDREVRIWTGPLCSPDRKGKGIALVWLGCALLVKCPLSHCRPVVVNHWLSHNLESNLLQRVSCSWHKISI